MMVMLAVHHAGAIKAIAATLPSVIAITIANHIHSGNCIDHPKRRAGD